MSMLEDELAIRTLAATYTDTINRRLAEQAVALYAPDGVLIFDGGRPITGDRLLKNFRYVLDTYPFIFQMTHSGIVELNGDTAKARWWLSEIGYNKTEHRLWAGTYEDELVRLPQGWRFKQRLLTTHFTAPYPPGSEHIVPANYQSVRSTQAG